MAKIIISLIDKLLIISRDVPFDKANNYFFYQDSGIFSFIEHRYGIHIHVHNYIFLAFRICERQRDADRRNDTRNEDDDEDENPLGKWPHAFSSVLACLGCTLGLFNISRFAILSVQFGGECIYHVSIIRVSWADFIKVLLNFFFLRFFTVTDYYKTEQRKL